MSGMKDDDMYGMMMEMQTLELQAECYRKLIYELRKVIPEKPFMKTVLDTVVSFYGEYDEFEAENIAHRMQKDFGFRMHEVDSLRDAMTD